MLTTSFELNRRQALLGTIAGLASLHAGTRVLSADLTDQRSLRVRSIERTTMLVPFRDTPARAMDREIPHWRYTEICDVELENGVHGYGETLLFYTWGATTDAAVRRAQGKNAASIMWNDENGAGLQMALFDAVARSLDMPVHYLLGQQVHDVTPLSWWNIDMPPEDMAAECKLALDSGYMSYKTKGRPWFDLWQQMDASSAVVPAEFKIDMDFNETLLTAEQAIPILERMARYPQIDIYESPIPQADIPGNAKICEALQVHIAMHYGTPAPTETVRQRVCDGFVVSGGASKLLQQAHFAATADMPFWLQLVGTSITAAWSLQFAAVCSHARWPAVNCHQLYVDPILQQPIQVQDGLADIPQKPGIGFDINWEAVERYRAAKPLERPEPERLIETTWSSGKKMYIGNTGQVNFMITHAMNKKIPFYEPGASTRLYPNDGSSRWRTLYEKAQQEPVFE